MYNSDNTDSWFRFSFRKPILQCAGNFIFHPDRVTKLPEFDKRSDISPFNANFKFYIFNTDLTHYIGTNKHARKNIDVDNIYMYRRR